MIDITASKQVEEALSISEERLRLANEAAHMGVWNQDLVTGRVEWVGGARTGLWPEPRDISWNFCQLLQCSKRIRTTVNV